MISVTRDNKTNSIVTLGVLKQRWGILNQNWQHKNRRGIAIINGEEMDWGHAQTKIDDSKRHWE